MDNIKFGEEHVRTRPTGTRRVIKEKVVYVYAIVDGHDCCIGEINQGIGHDKSVLIYHHRQQCVGHAHSIEGAKKMLIDGNFDILLQKLYP